MNGQSENPREPESGPVVAGLASPDEVEIDEPIRQAVLDYQAGRMGRIAH